MPAGRFMQRGMLRIGPCGSLGSTKVPSGCCGSGVAVDVEHPVDHLDAVAGQADQPLDVVGAVGRMLEDHHVAALRIAGEDAPVERADRERAGVARIAVRHLVDEQEVADQERRLHRARRDPERLEEQGADDAGEQQRVDDGLDELEKPALGLALRHHPPVRCPARRARLVAPAPDRVKATVRRLPGRKRGVRRSGASMAGWRGPGLRQVTATGPLGLAPISCREPAA